MTIVGNTMGLPSVNTEQMVVSGSKGKGTDQNGFDLMMKNQISGSNDSEQSFSEKAVANQSSDNKKEEYHSISSKDSKVSEKTISETQKQMDSENEATVAEVEAKIQKVIKETLGIDEEQIAEVLESMGIVLIDLLNPEQLTQFFLQVEGGVEMSDLLVDGDMTNNLSDLMKQMQEISDMIPELSVAQETEVFADSQSVETMASEALETMVLNDNVENVNDTVEDVVKVDGIIQESADNQEPVVIVDDQRQGQMEEDSENNSNQTQAEMQENVELPSSSRQAEEFVGVVNNFQSNMTQVVQETSTVQVTQTTVQIIQQIVQQIRVTLQVDATSMEMQLNPENLGKVLLNVSAKEGVMTASFTVQSEEARIAIESQLQTLRTVLEEKEIKVEAVEVTVSNFEFTSQEQSQEDSKNSDQGDGRSRRYEVVSEDDETEVTPEQEAERVRQSVMRDSGGSVDFTA